MDALPPALHDALRRFRDFYDELFAVKRIVRAADWPALIGERAAEDQEQAVLRAVRQRLRDVIMAQGFGRAAPPGAAAPSVEAEYVMTAVADEALLHGCGPWPGRAGWQETPLEAVLYRSRIGGDRVFEAAESLIKQQDHKDDGLALTLLLALEVGFRGRYYSASESAENGAIHRLKRALRDFVFHEFDPAEAAAGSLIEGAAEPLRATQSYALPRLRPWLLAIGATIAAYFVISWIVWRVDVGPVISTAHAAIRAFASLPAGR